MKCPICMNEMEKGGIIVNGRDLLGMEWYPEAEFCKEGLKGWRREGGKAICDTDITLFSSKYSNCFCCSKCGKIIGIFDIDERTTKL